MRGPRSLFPLLLMLVLAMTAVALHAQGRARVVTQELNTGEFNVSPWMVYDQASGIAYDCVNLDDTRSLSCWMELERKFWFIPLRPQRIDIVRVYRTDGTKPPKRHRGTTPPKLPKSQHGAK
ncbi:MAG: hypothetical protein P4L67_01625 [Candidatus Pacebacteria bacterium]|nr:hypothetical protein [Candidatus Paceibacterota bacterium]